MFTPSYGRLKATADGAGKQAGHDIIYNFDQASLREAHPSHEVPPFAVICSRTMDQAIGRRALLLA